MVVLLDTHAKVRLSDGESVQTGIKKLPRFLPPWMARFGPAAKFDPGNTVDGVLDDDVAGFGWFPEAEDPAELGENQKLGPRDSGTLDTEQNLFVYARAAVDLTQAEIDARDDAAGQQRSARAAVLIAKVKDDAEAARLRFLTPGSGKALEYEAKRKEAMEYLAAKTAAAPDAPTVSLALYPWAFRTAKALNGGADPSAAQIIVQCELFAARATAWEAIGQTIAGLEQAAVTAIEAARDSANDAAMEAAAVVGWPEPQ